MTKRAILYCGHVKEPMIRRDERGRLREVIHPLSGFPDPLFGTDDAKIQCNSLELSFQAALSDAVPRTRLSLDEAFARAAERLRAAEAPTLPLRAGAAEWPA